MCARATQPEPSTPSPHAVAVIRTTLGRARTTAAEERTRVSGGTEGGAGPAICGNGSTRAKARRTVRGGAIVFSRCRISDFCTSARSFVWPGSWSSTAPATQTIASPSAAPAARPPSESSIRSGGMTASAPRANDPIIDATVCSNSAPTTAPPSPTSGV
jgi:hypothetical protein